VTRPTAPRLEFVSSRPALRVARLAVFVPMLVLTFHAEAQGPAAATPPIADSQPRAIATPIQIPNLPLGLVSFPNGKAFNLNVAMGSALHRNPNDPPGRIWMLTDRGPNIDCAEARRIFGQEPETLCPGARIGRVYPLPGFAPSIYGADIGPDNVARIHSFLPLKGKSGKPVSGRPPAAPNGKNEGAFAMDGKALPYDPSGVDPEAIVRLSDGSFWIGEEFGPSLLQVSSDGTILRRLVPNGAAADFRDADYDVQASLPGIMRQRANNRGFEGLALSPDERFLYVMMQSALANPDSDTARRSRHVRLWKIAIETGEAVAQYLYEQDEPKAFGADADARERAQSVVMISEIVAIGEDRLLVQERIDRSTRIFAVSLHEDSLVPRLFDNPDYGPGLEWLAADKLAPRGIKPLEKQLIFDTDSISGLPAKIEGMAYLAPQDLLLINDNDFGMEGVRTQLFRVTLPRPIR
jgi:Esterase-like activity of phytase